MGNIPVFFCNIDIQRLQHASKTSEKLETYYCSGFHPFFRMMQRHRVGGTGDFGEPSAEDGGTAMAPGCMLQLLVDRPQP
jgi:hypothetical protein